MKKTQKQLLFAAIAADQELNRQRVQEAEAAGIDHSWINNVVNCCFNRARLASDYNGGDWMDGHILHRYQIDRYRVLTQNTCLPQQA